MPTAKQARRPRRAKPRALTHKMKMFVAAYVKTQNATQAYIDAGYAADNRRLAGVEGHKLLKIPKIR